MGNKKKSQKKSSEKEKTINKTNNIISSPPPTTTKQESSSNFLNDIFLPHLALLVAPILSSVNTTLSRATFTVYDESKGQEPLNPVTFSILRSIIATVIYFIIKRNGWFGSASSTPATKPEEVDGGEKEDKEQEEREERERELKRRKLSSSPFDSSNQHRRTKSDISIPDNDAGVLSASSPSSFQDSLDDVEGYEAVPALTPTVVEASSAAMSVGNGRVAKKQQHIDDKDPLQSGANFVDWFWLILLGFFGIAVNFMCFFHGLEFTSGLVAAGMMTLTPSVCYAIGILSGIETFSFL